MDVSRTEEQTELAAMVRQLLDKRAGSDQVRAGAAAPRGLDEDLWSTLCEQVGVASLAVPEEYGGAGFTLAESFVVLEELGRSLAPTPLLGALMTTEALLASDDGDACARLLPRVAAGEIAAVALGTDSDGDVVRDVLYGDVAEVLLALTGDGLTEVTGPATTRTPAMDPTLRLARLDLATSTTTAIDVDAAVVRDRVLRVARTGAAALGVGLAQRGLDMTVSYTGERVQFGRPIGSFQALKHRMADMLVQVETARSITWAAANAVAGGGSKDGTDADRLAVTTASYVAEAAHKVAAETVQLHGGIAITWEHDAHLLLKRAQALGQLFGQPHQLRAELAPTL